MSTSLTCISLSSPIADIALSYTFSCHENRGAIAILEDTAKQERAVRSLAFRQYICHHHASWYALAKKLDVYVQPSDLVLVYGCVKTSAWALATFSSNNSDHKLSLSVSGPSFPSAKFEASGHQDVNMSMEQRAGPQRPPSTPTQGHEPDEAPKDQCLFLDYYKLKTRKPGMTILQGEAKAQDAIGSSENQCFCIPYSWLIPQRFRKLPGAHPAANDPGTGAASAAEVEYPRLVAPVRFCSCSVTSKLIFRAVFRSFGLRSGLHTGGTSLWVQFVQSDNVHRNYCDYRVQRTQMSPLQATTTCITFVL